MNTNIRQCLTCIALRIHVLKTPIAAADLSSVLLGVLNRRGGGLLELPTSVDFLPLIDDERSRHCACLSGRTQTWLMIRFPSAS